MGTKLARKITTEMGLPRLHFDAPVVAPKPWTPMDVVEKQTIVDKIESDLRMIAWAQKKLNMLIGEDKTSVEPVWDKEMNVI